MNGATIAAISTPRGYGGVGIVKISGPDAVRIARQIFRTGSAGPALEDRLPEPEQNFPSHRLRYGIIVNPVNGRRIDEVLLSTMLGPKSYTGEDVVEINAHAGPVVLDAILGVLLEQGAVLAEPGEFTRRAFLNGRIDLTQAEAVIDLINAKTAACADRASAVMAGGLRQEIEKIKDSLRRLISYNEARLDFPEDIEDEGPLEEEGAGIKNEIIAPLKKILSRFREGRILRDGLRLAVVGRPNVGKSSLMNRLIKEDRVIVTDIPGTTRDAVEDCINVQGIPVVIIDTAGLQESCDPVEKIGMEKTLQNIERADLILFVVEAGREIQAGDGEIYAKIGSKDCLIVMNKVDLGTGGAARGIPDAWKKHPVARISALTGEGIGALESEIAGYVTGGKSAYDMRDHSPNLRQKKLIEKSLKAAQAAMNSRLRGDSGEFTALDLALCLDGLKGVLGENLQEDVLGQIFSEFCIGK